MSESDIWVEAAKKLGWKWSNAHGGYIHEDHRRPNVPRNQWGSYQPEEDPEDACFVSGVETLTQAAAVVEAEAA